MLYPVATFENSSAVSTSSKLYMIKPGKMQLVGDKWVITEKMIIGIKDSIPQNT